MSNTTADETNSGASAPRFASENESPTPGTVFDGPGHFSADDAEVQIAIDPSDPRCARVTFRAGGRVSLTRLLHLMRDMDVEVLDERTSTSGDGLNARTYELDVELHGGRPTDQSLWDASTLPTRFADTFRALWRSDIDSDRFNALVVHVGLSWREALILRTYSRYLKQVGFPFGARRIVHVLTMNAEVCRAFIALFTARFNPDAPAGDNDAAAEIYDDVVGMLNDVADLDSDRILRAFLSLIMATTRTNFYVEQSRSGAVHGLAIKLTPRDVSEVPQPRPEIETYVYSPRFEAVHLRYGRVARGGLRWSDRPDDFRTEILGLVKTQAIKNSVIVPAGAKGGFVVKQAAALLFDDGSRPATSADARECYRGFISALLDITDNLSPAGTVVTPARVVAHDGEDTYLVVAADKGTAAFSDIANAVAHDYEYWLGDAFASGGSVGYDHKKMAITARGAWESVRRHFAELDIDPQHDEFTVVGIGDMSGDVFGNGMLLSRRLRLIAAFDHRDIFVDPDPDPASSFAERSRLFSQPGSSWQDYDPHAVSAGGGVWDRTRKSIPISPQMRDALAIDASVTAMSPPELIKAILTAPVDVLWNGGIGTYVKAEQESNADVGDKANDNVRVDAHELRAKIAAEGGNLGFTQKARIQFALRGGLINTDAIDNSAGVSCSDREVNIKILLDALPDPHALTPTQRAELLDQMSDEVAQLVLKDNISQNATLATARSHAPQFALTHRRMIAHLERANRVDRELDTLPSPREFAARIARNEGLTTPELATLLAHVKLHAKEQTLASGRTDLPFFADFFLDYFPGVLQNDYFGEIHRHPLRREIAASQAVNRMVDIGGISFAFRLLEETGASVVDCLSAYLATSAIFQVDSIWQRIYSGTTSTATTADLVSEVRRLLDRGSRWLLSNTAQPIDIGAAIERYAGPVAALSPSITSKLSGFEASWVCTSTQQWIERGVGDDLARAVSELLYRYSILDIVEVADESGCALEDAADTYFRVSDRFEVDRWLAAVSAVPHDDRWNAMAQLQLRDDLYGALRTITFDVLRSQPSGLAAIESIERWCVDNRARVERSTDLLSEVITSGELNIARLSVAAAQLRNLGQ